MDAVAFPMRALKFRWAVCGENYEGDSGQISFSHAGVEFSGGGAARDNYRDRRAGGECSANRKKARRSFIDSHVERKGSVASSGQRERS